MGGFTTPPPPAQSLSFLVVKMWKMAPCTGQLKGRSKKWAKSACESLDPIAAGVGEGVAPMITMFAFVFFCF